MNNPYREHRKLGLEMSMIEARASRDKLAAETADNELIGEAVKTIDYLFSNIDKIRKDYQELRADYTNKIGALEACLDKVLQQEGF